MGMYGENVTSRGLRLEEAYQHRIDQIQKATGIGLVNPARVLTGVRQRRASRSGQAAVDPYAEFDQKLADLKKQFPQHAEVIAAERSPRIAAMEKLHAVKQGAADDLAAYDGAVPGLGTLTQFAGVIAASGYDPTTWATAMIGPWRAARWGWSGLAVMAGKAGAANAGVELALYQPALWRANADAGLEYGLHDALFGGAAAFVFGAGLDGGVRGAVRGVQTMRGQTPDLNEAGEVTGWRSPADGGREPGRSPDAVFDEAPEQAPPERDPAAVRFYGYEQDGRLVYSRSRMRARSQAPDDQSVWVADLPSNRMADIVVGTNTYELPDDIPLRRLGSDEPDATLMELSFDTMIATRPAPPSIDPARGERALNQAAHALDRKSVV